MKNRLLIGSENSYKAIFDNSLDAILITVPDGKILAANPAACEMFLCTEADIIKAGREGLVDLSDKRLQVLLEARASNSKVRGELTFKRKNGTFFQGEVTSSLFADISGETRTVMQIRDLTDLKLLEKSVTESEINLRALIDAVDDSLFLVKTDGTIILANNGLASAFGKDLNNIIGTNTYNLVPDEVARHRKELANMVIKDKKARIFTDVRSDRYIENRVFPVTDETGSVIRLAIFGRDITEKKIAEEALAKSEFKFRTLTSLLPAGIYMTDENGKCTYVNEEWCSMTGLTPDEAYGDGWTIAMHPDDREHVFNMWNIFVNSGNNWSWNYRIIHKSGKIRWVFGTARPIYDSNRKLSGFLGTNTDITDRIKTEENLIQSEERFRLLSEQSGVGVGFYSPEGKILFFNHQAMKNLGGKIDDFEGKSLAEAFGKKQGAKYLKRVKEEIRLKKNLKFEDCIESQKGKSWISLSHTNVSDSAGNLIGVQVVSHDITEIKLIEEKLSNTAKELRELTRHLNEIREEERTRIAHDLHDDLGQKLTALNMDIAWLKSRVGVQSVKVENKFQQMFSILNESIESIQKISYGLRPSILDDLGLIPALEWLLKEFKKTSGIVCNFSFSPKNLLVENVISLTVFRIVQEALTNVARHSGADRVSIKVNLSDEILEIIIKDNGSGIEQEKVDAAKSFGLIGMRERVRVHAGEVYITGKKGKGTIISVTIPVSQ